MRISDYIEQSFSDLAKKKLRTSLTTFGVVIGIGALVSMFSFGKGVQKNITESFAELGLLNYVSVLPASQAPYPGRSFERPRVEQKTVQHVRVLDGDFIDEITKMEGVESAFAEIRFPALVRFKQKEDFGLVQVLPADICRSGPMKLRAGKSYASDDANSLIISDSLLHRMEIKDPEAMIGEQVEVSTLTFDISLFSPATFALVDGLQEIKTAFIFMDMFLFAVAMIAITVASLGIINTMVMSILERYREIGIMKAVGASDGDVKRIFFFESGVIGFLGGILGLALGWTVSVLVNQVANLFLARKGVPYVDYFSFPWWLCMGAVAFSVLVSLAAGIYPTLRAARVDPVVALRHD